MIRISISTAAFEAIAATLPSISPVGGNLFLAASFFCP
jgi:hypothetical protein